MRAGDIREAYNSEKSWDIQITSQVVAAKARYSASAEEWDKLIYFLAFQDKKESPKNMQKPAVDLRESTQEA